MHIKINESSHMLGLLNTFHQTIGWIKEYFEKEAMTLNLRSFLVFLIYISILSIT